MQPTSFDPKMSDWQGLKEMKIMKEYFDARYAQTCQIISESNNENQVLTQMHCFMISLQQKVMKLCPIIKDMMGEDDALMSYQKQGLAIKEILARVSQLQ